MTKGKTRAEGEATPAETGGTQRVYDLAERTARFGEAVIRFCRAFPKSVVNDPLIRQVVRSGTSIGANYCEADDAVSDKEFRQKIGTCKKEARETKHWMRMLAADPDSADAARVLWREAHELTLIFVAIFRKVSKRRMSPRRRRVDRDRGRRLSSLVIGGSLLIGHSPSGVEMSSVFRVLLLLLVVLPLVSGVGVPPAAARGPAGGAVAGARPRRRHRRGRRAPSSPSKAATRGSVPASITAPRGSPPSSSPATPATATPRSAPAPPASRC